MKLLALDSATEACSAALYIDGEITQRYEIAPRRHSRLILPMVDALIRAAGIAKTDLDAIAFCRGPGSFMGVRIATGVAQGIAFALSLPVVPVSSLAAMAMVNYQKTGATHNACAIDARMHEVYWGCYEITDSTIPLLIGEEQVLAPQQLSLATPQKWDAVGTGWGAYGELIDQQLISRLHRMDPQCLPDASAIATIAVSMFAAGQSVSAAQAVPVYLRNNVAQTMAERARAKLL